MLPASRPLSAGKVHGHTFSECRAAPTEKMACTVASKPGGDRRLQLTVPAAQAQAKVIPCRSSTCSHAGRLSAATAAQSR